MTKKSKPLNLTKEAKQSIIKQNMQNMAVSLKDAIYEKSLGLIYEKADFIYESITWLKQETEDKLLTAFNRVKENKEKIGDMHKIKNPTFSKVIPLESQANDVVNICVDFKYTTIDWNIKYVNIAATTLIEIESTKLKNSDIDILPKLQTKLIVSELIGDKYKRLD